MSAIVFTRADLGAGSVMDVRVEHGRVDAIGPGVDRPGDEVIDCAGGALLPGLHDHHIHLLSLAASLASVDAGPPAVTDRVGLQAALRTAPPTADGWIRAVQYHESVAGELDRWSLDAIVNDRPVRMQHRSGALWMLNSRALEVAGIDSDTGRLFRSDAALHRLPSALPELAPVGKLLASFGVTAVTDATVDLGDEAFAALERAVSSGELQVSVTVLGAIAPAESPLATGPHKIVLDEARGIDPAAVAGEIATAHAGGRAVAIHCVTITEVLLAIDAIAAAGPLAGDRLEHASELPFHADERLRALGLTVVTQPGFVFARGDSYLAEVAPEDHEILYRCGSLLGAGIPVGGSTDAPFGPADPWLAVRAAVDRRTRSGAVLGPAERIAARRALDLFLAPLDEPGGPPRRVLPGSPGDLCLLHLPLDEALASPTAVNVRLTHSER